MGRRCRGSRVRRRGGLSSARRSQARGRERGEAFVAAAAVAAPVAASTAAAATAAAVVPRDVPPLGPHPLWRRPPPQQDPLHPREQPRSRVRCEQRPAAAQQLRDLGVLYWKVPPGTDHGTKKLDAIKQVRGYSYEDTIDVCPEKLENYEAKIKCFYEEHVHTDEEIRYVREGSGESF